LRLIERRVFLVKRQGDLGQPVVGLLELGLLVFKIHLILLEHPRFFFQLFIDRAQFFLLRLQVFVEPLAFLQHVLQPPPIKRRVNGVANIGGDHVDELQIARAERAQKPEFEHAVDLAVVLHRHHQHMTRRALAQAGGDFQVVVGQVVELQHPVFKGGLAYQAFGTVERLLCFFIAPAEAIGRHTPQAAVVFPHIQGRHGSIKITRHEFQYAAAERFHPGMADRVFGQFQLSGAQPKLLIQQQRGGGLLVLGLAVSVRQLHQFAPANESQQTAQAQAEQQIGRHAPKRGVSGLVVALLQLALFNADELGELAPNLVSQAFSAGGANRLLVVEVCAAKGNNVLRIFIPLSLQRPDAPQPADLCLVVADQQSQRICFGGDARLANFKRLQQWFFAGDEVAVHAGFHVGAQLGDQIGVGDRPLCLRDPAQG